MNEVLGFLQFPHVDVKYKGYILYFPNLHKFVHYFHPNVLTFSSWLCKQKISMLPGHVYLYQISCWFVCDRNFQKLMTLVGWCLLWKHWVHTVSHFQRLRSYCRNPTQYSDHPASTHFHWLWTSCLLVEFCSDTSMI